jgi:hypothetical protein
MPFPWGAGAEDAFTVFFQLHPNRESTSRRLFDRVQHRARALYSSAPCDSSTSAPAIPRAASGANRPRPNRLESRMHCLSSTHPEL